MNQKQIEEILTLVGHYGDELLYPGSEDSDVIFEMIREKLRESCGWQPIETAPKDQWVFVAYPDGEVSKGIFNLGVWIDWDGDIYGTPTHWQPLLEAPCEQPS